MTKKRTMSTLGAALLAGVTLATMVAPAANAATAASADTKTSITAGQPTGQQVKLVAPSGGRIASLTTDNYDPNYGNGSVRFSTTHEDALAIAGSLLVIARGHDIAGRAVFNLVDPAQPTNCLVLSSPGAIIFRTSVCDDPQALLFQPQPGQIADSDPVHTTYLTAATTRVDSSGLPFFKTSRNSENAATFEGLNIVLPGDEKPFAADGAFTSTVTDRGVASGTGTVGATITVTDTAGKTVATATVGADGSFSTAIDAPNAGGDYNLNATQTVDGTTSAAIRVTLAYGAGVTIATPADGAAHTPGPVALTGAGTPGGRITITEGTSTLGTATVAADGSWSATTSSLDAAEHVITVTQLSKGNNTTTAKVTLNPGASNVRDLVVATPVDGGTVPSTGGRITVTGTGQPGSDVSITASNGRLAGTGKVAADGTFSFPAVFNSVFYNATVKQVAPTGQTQSKSIGFTVVASDGVNLPFSVTSPTTNGTVRSTNKMITVTGNGKAGAAVKITAANGRIAGQGVVGADGRYSFPAEFQALPYTATVTMTPAMGAAENITITNFTVVANEGVNLPFRVTAPVTNGTASSTNKMVTFTGEGKAGATIRIIAASNGRMAGQGVVGADGRFSVQAEFAALKYSAYVDMVPTAGAKETITVSDFTVVSTDGVNKPFRVTAPVSNGTAPSVDKMVTFRGEGTAGDTVKIIAASNGRLAGQGVVDQNGDFSVQAEFAALKYTAHVDMVTPSGMKETITVTDFQVTAQ